MKALGQRFQARNPRWRPQRRASMVWNSIFPDELSFHAYKMNPDPNPNPNPNRDNPNNLLDTIILLGYNVQIGCLMKVNLQEICEIARK